MLKKFDRKFEEILVQLERRRKEKLKEFERYFKVILGIYYLLLDKGMTKVR